MTTTFAVPYHFGLPAEDPTHIVRRMQRPTPSLVFLVVALFLGAAVARAADTEITEAMVEQRLSKGAEFAAGGYGPQALKEFLWCYDEGMVAVPKFRGMRTTVLVSMIKRLASSHGPAEEAMIKRCADAETRLLAGDAAAAAEFSAWCDALGGDSRLLKTFDKIPAGDPRRRGFGIAGLTALLGKKRYADAASTMSFEAMVRMADDKISRVPKNPEDEDPRQDAAIKQLLDFIEVLAGAKDKEHADQMVAKLKAFDSSGTTKRDIEKRLKRAGA